MRSTIALLAAVGLSSAAEFSVSSDNRHVLGGAEAKLELALRNPARSAFKAELHYRIFQLSYSLYRPVGEGKKWQSVEIPADTSKHAVFTHTFPEVRAASRFQVAWFTSDGKRVAGFDLTVHPKDLLQPLQSLVEKNLLGLWDSDERLLPVLTALKMKPEVMHSRWNAEDFRGETLVVVHGPGQKTRLDEKLTVFDKLNRNRVSVICLLEDSETPLPLTVGGAGKASTVFAKLDSISNLLEQTDAQVRLLRLLEISRHRNPAQLLIRNEK